MIKANTENYAKHKVRAALKVAFVLIVIAVIAVIIDIKLNDPAMNRLKLNLSLPSLIMLVVAINAVSLFSIAVLYTAYQWVRRDLKAPRSEDVSDIND